MNKCDIFSTSSLTTSDNRQLINYFLTSQFFKAQWHNDFGTFGTKKYSKISGLSSARFFDQEYKGQDGEDAAWEDVVQPSNTHLGLEDSKNCNLDLISDFKN